MSSIEHQVPMASPPLAETDAGRLRLRSLAGLQYLRRRALVNTLQGKLSSAQWQLWMALFTSLVFWCGLYVVFRGGFELLERNQLVSSFLVELLFGVYFSTLLMMLVFSTAIILYAGLFDSDETRLLLVRPIPADFVFGLKFQESLFFSSWGFVLLGSPMLVAYGVTVSAPIAFYFLAAIYLVAYCLLPASVGSLICLGVTALIPRRKNEILAAGVVIGLLLGGLFLFRAWRAATSSNMWLLQLLQQMQLSNLPFLPSHWISKGLLAATFPGGLPRSLFFLGVLISNSLLAYLIASWAYAQRYRYAYDRVHSHNFFRKRRESNWLPAVVHRTFGFLPAPVRVLIVKDVRTFSRDPVQFLQLSIFTGLIALYIVLLSRVTHYAEHPYWRNMISFLNLSVMALFLTVFTSRFVFPLLSLEGQRLWILGLCPIGRDSIMWGKFVFSAAGAILLTSGLMLLSTLILNFDALLVAVQLTLVLILGCGVSGISVGLGARFANQKERDPSRIASGIPGTLNLVVSLFFIVFVISSIAVPYHFYSLTLTPDAEQAEAVRHVQKLRVPGGDGMPWADFRIWLTLSLSLCVAAGLTAVLLPMRLGIRAFRKMEV